MFSVQFLFGKKFQFLKSFRKQKRVGYKFSTSCAVIMKKPQISVEERFNMKKPCCGGGQLIKFHSNKSYVL